MNPYEPVELSKTQIKNQMHELQELGVRLTKLSAETLVKIDLPEALVDALLLQKKITSHGALKRQIQYIGRLMRQVDTEPIRIFLDTLAGENNAHNAFLHRLEALRTELLLPDNGSALAKLLTEYPHIDGSKIRTLIRNARKEKEQNKPPKAYRVLFQELKQAIEK